MMACRVWVLQVRAALEGVLGLEREERERHNMTLTKGVKTRMINGPSPLSRGEGNGTSLPIRQWMERRLMTKRQTERLVWTAIRAALWGVISRLAYWITDRFLR